MKDVHDTLFCKDILSLTDIITKKVFCGNCGRTLDRITLCHLFTLSRFTNPIIIRGSIFSTVSAKAHELVKQITRIKGFVCNIYENNK